MNEVTDIFDLRETKLSFRGVDSDVLVGRFGFVVYEYIVDVYFACFVNKSGEDLVLHTALKVWASSFQSHSKPVFTGIDHQLP